jgi:hypothetical protein
MNIGKNKKAWKACEEEVIRFFAEQGATHVEMYDIFPTRSHDTINKKSLAMGVMFSKKKIYTPVRDVLHRHLTDGWTNKEIADTYDWDERKIVSILNTVGLKRTDADKVLMRQRVNAGEVKDRSLRERPVYDVEYFEKRIEEVTKKLMSRKLGEDTEDLVRELRNLEIKLMCLEQEFKQTPKYINDDCRFLV